MSVTIKSAKEIELMREAGRLLEIVHKELEEAIRPGISTWELDHLGEKTIRYKGMHSDAARTHAVGQITPEAQKLIDVTRQSFFEGIKKAVAGNHLFDISNAIADYVEPFGYGIVEELVGHGIGHALHEDPQIPNFRQKRKGIRLMPGMTLAIEPMINIGRPDVEWLDDDWTVVTEDGSLSAHYENTILINEEGEPDILTLGHV